MTSPQEYYRDYWGKGMGDWSARFPPPSETETELLTAFIPKDARLLDVGCGDGKVARALKSFHIDYRGIDISSEAIDLCRKQGFVSELHNLDEPLPFDDRSFDAVTIFEVMEHLFLPHKTVGELSRVLKPGGLLIGSVPNFAQISNRLLFLLGKFNPGGSPATSLKTPWMDPHIRFFNYRTMKAMLESDPELEIVKMPGKPFLLLDQPYLYKAAGPVRKALSILQWPLKPLGRIWPSLFSHRIYFVARKKAGASGA